MSGDRSTPLTIAHDPTSDAMYIHLRPDVAYAFGEDLDTSRRKENVVLRLDVHI